MRHIYVHVPFCARRCVYCDFAIAVRRNVPSERYVRAVLAELTRRVERDEWDEEEVETLYFGGGTPSQLPAAVLAQLLQRFRATLGWEWDHGGSEVTLEANPDDVTAHAARTWAAAGITRVSLGAQSFDDRVLRWMRRTHDSAAIGRAVQLLRASGITAISIDLIFGLPGRVGGSVSQDLARALALQPPHLSLYGLTVEPATPFGKWVATGRAHPVTDRRYEQEFLEVHETLVAAGYEHYEVSNYAVPGQRSRHNTSYWSGAAYGGLGPGAHAYHREERRWNLRHWAAYERTVVAGRDPTAGREVLSADQRHLERVYLGLRTAAGVGRNELAPSADPVVRAGELQGWLIVEDGCVRLTPAGWLRLDQLVPALTTSTEGG